MRESPHKITELEERIAELEQKLYDQEHVRYGLSHPKGSGREQAEYETWDEAHGHYLLARRGSPSPGLWKILDYWTNPPTDVTKGDPDE